MGTPTNQFRFTAAVTLLAGIVLFPALASAHPHDPCPWVPEQLRVSMHGGGGDHGGMNCPMPHS